MVTISEHPQNLQIAQIPFTSSPTFSLEWGKGIKERTWGGSVGKGRSLHTLYW